MSFITATNALQTNSIDRVTAGQLVIGGTNATSIALNEPTSVTGLLTANTGISTNSIQSILTTDQIEIGTVRSSNGADPNLNPAIKIGKSGNTVRIGNNGSGKLQVNNIDTVPSDNVLYICADNDSNGSQINMLNNLYVNSAISVVACSLLFLNNGADSIIDVDGNYPLRIAPDPAIFPETLCNAIFLGNTSIPATISGSSITLVGQVSISTSGSIPTPNATTRTLQAFGTTFTGTLPPKVYLTYDAGSSSTSIVTVCLAGFDGIAGAWTGFYYLTSTSSAGIVGSKLNWIAVN